jgi:hypothetical protein
MSEAARERRVLALCDAALYLEAGGGRLPRRSHGPTVRATSAELRDSTPASTRELLGQNKMYEGVPRLRRAAQNQR